MQSYPSQSHAKVLVKPQEKSLNIRKTGSIGIGHDRRLTICHNTFCPMVLEKLFQVLTFYIQWYFSVPITRVLDVLLIPLNILRILLLEKDSFYQSPKTRHYDFFDNLKQVSAYKIQFLYQKSCYIIYYFHDNYNMCEYI